MENDIEQAKNVRIHLVDNLFDVMKMRPQEDKRLVLLRKSLVTQQNETRFTIQFIYNQKNPGAENENHNVIYCGKSQ